MFLFKNTDSNPCSVRLEMNAQMFGRTLKRRLGINLFLKIRIENHMRPMTVTLKYSSVNIFPCFLRSIIRCAKRPKIFRGGGDFLRNSLRNNPWGSLRRCFEVSRGSVGSHYFWANPDTYSRVYIVNIILKYGFRPEYGSLHLLLKCWADWR